MKVLTATTVPLPRLQAPPLDPTSAGYPALVAAARDEAVLDTLAGAGLPAGARAALAGWAAPTSWQVRHLLLVRAGDELAGAGLAVRRPLTSHLRLAGWWSAVPGDRAVADALVAEADRLAAADRLARLTVQVAAADDVLWSAGQAAGLTPLDPPALGAPLPHDPATLPRGLRRTLVPVVDRPVPYMRQTTDYTCGPVSTSMALASSGIVDLPNRRDELTLWREATYQPGCDPFGLAVAIAARGGAPAVLTSSADPVLVDGDESTREMQTFVQTDFRERAVAAGVPVETGWPQVTRLRAHLSAGGVALLLIDQYPMHLEPCPHWITAHGVWGDDQDGGVLVDDPWTDVDLGESWLDASGLALPNQTVDRLWRWGEPAARAALLLP
jgi:hypothetical protein